MPRSDSGSRVAEALATLEGDGDPGGRDRLARFGIPTAHRVIGVAMGDIQEIGKALGRDHELAGELWETEVLEARLLNVDDPALVTPEQMDPWARDFDNWGICDTLCFALFDKTPHAFDMVDLWADDPAEYVKRAAFALLASLALHDKKREDEPFLARMKVIEAAAGDDRNFVKKGVSWALRAIGGRKSPALRAAAREVADRLAASSDRTERWVGKEAQRAFAKADAKSAPPFKGGD